MLWSSLFQKEEVVDFINGIPKRGLSEKKIKFEIYKYIINIKYGIQ